MQIETLPYRFGYSLRPASEDAGLFCFFGSFLPDTDQPLTAPAATPLMMCFWQVR